MGTTQAYRWVVLGVTLAVNATMQLLWVAYAAATLDAQRFYGVGTTAVGAFSMIFMLAFIPLSLPASWLIDKAGVRWAVGGAMLLAGVGGVLRGLVGDAYALALAATVLPAIAQPVVLNAWTATVHPWFAQRHRTTAVSLITLANLVGTALGLVLTPVLLGRWRMDTLMLGYGAVTLASAVVFLLLARDRPTGADAHRLEEAELGRTLRQSWLLAARRPMPLLLAVAVVAYGTFNGVTTWVEPIVAPVGLDAAGAGTFGALMLAGGLVGAVVVSAICDRTGRRVPALVACLAGSAAALVVVALARTAVVEYAAGTVLGFFLVSCLPVAIEYATEIAHPLSPAVPNGLVQLFGQASVVLVLASGAAGEWAGSFRPVLLVGAAFLVACAASGRMLRTRAAWRARCRKSEKGLWRGPSPGANDGNRTRVFSLGS